MRNEKIVYEDVHELCACIDDILTDDTLELDDDFAVSVFGNYEIIIDVLNILCKFYDYTPYSLEINPWDISGYEKEYILQVGTDGKIWVQTANNDGVYITVDANYDAVFIHKDCDEMLISKNTGCHAFLFSYIDEIDEKDCCFCENKCDEYELKDLKSEDGEYGFTMSWKDNWFSFYSTDEKLVKDMSDYIKKECFEK